MHSTNVFIFVVTINQIDMNIVLEPVLEQQQEQQEPEDTNKMITDKIIKNIEVTDTTIVAQCISMQWKIAIVAAAVALVAVAVALAAMVTAIEMDHTNRIMMVTFLSIGWKKIQN